MDTLDLDNAESTFVIWSEKSLLILAEFSLRNYTCKDQVLFSFLEGLTDMKLPAISLFFKCFLFVGKLEVVQKVFEKVNALMSFV
jgi:hypothetical protein